MAYINKYIFIYFIIIKSSFLLFAGDPGHGIPGGPHAIEYGAALNYGCRTEEERKKLFQKKLIFKILLHGCPSNIEYFSMIKNKKSVKTISIQYPEPKIEKFPEIMCQFTNLEFLNLVALNNGQGDLEVPECIGDLTKLKFLGLRSNNIKKLPESIGQLINLEKLYLENNQLEYLPESIRQLKNLKEIELIRNKPSLGKINYGTIPVSSTEWFWDRFVIGKNNIGKRPKILKPERGSLYVKVTATSGLRIRDWHLRPSLDNPKIGLLKFNTIVMVTSITRDSITVNGITAPWYWIIYKDAAGNLHRGWIFSGYTEKVDSKLGKEKAGI